MEAELLAVLADCCLAVISEMSQAPVRHISLRKDERLQENYAFAQFVRYEDFPGKVGGFFVLGFPSEAMAVAVASAIAENYGLPPLRHLDETAKDILNETMNTIIGHTVTAWDKKGFRVRFIPPAAIEQAVIHGNTFADHEVHKIILDLAGGQMIFKVTCNLNSQAPPGKRVLVVDDSGVIRGILAKALKEAGYTVELAEDGRAALEKYQVIQPHLTIMDLNMPKMGGLEAMQRIRALDKDARFIVLTSTARRDEELIARTLKVCAYLIKPVQMQDFLPVVEKALE
jgi:two-component system chemotaxis response regulator CheY